MGRREEPPFLESVLELELELELELASKGICKGGGDFEAAQVGELLTFLTVRRNLLVCVTNRIHVVIRIVLNLVLLT